MIIMMKSYEIEFKELFGNDYEYKFFSPGRINLIGEHIDYNGGHVLPIAINLGIYALVSKRKDKKFAFFSDNYFEKGVITTNNFDFFNEDGFANYPKAVIRSMLDAGITFPFGLNIYYYSTLSEQAGLSSGACIEVLTATVLNEIYKLNLTSLELAIRCHKAQSEYLQLNSGIMDQCSISLAREKNALFLDNYMLNYEYIPYDLGDYSIVVCQTNKPSKKINSRYKKRVRECQRALDIIKNNFNVLTLTKIPEEYLEMIQNILPDDVLYKRVLHVVTEEKRVLKTIEAFKNKDIDQFAQAMNESHESLRDNYDVSSPELNTIVELARNEQGCIASRMTGAGFGGCALALVHNDFLVEFKENMAIKYKQATGLSGAFFEVDAYGGPRRLPKDAESLADAIASLVQYAIDMHLIEEDDRIYSTNRILSLLNLDYIDDGDSHPEPLHMILDTIVNYAVSKNIIENTQEAKNSFETTVMNVFVPRPSYVIKEFYNKKKKNPDLALEYLYELSTNSNYIRKNLVDTNIFFNTSNIYGEMVISINQSRIEKDSQTKEKLLNIESINYPKCLLCKESVGYHGRLDYPARDNLRSVPVTLSGEDFYLQYSPYPYFKEHSIVINAHHVQVNMNEKTFRYMFDFVKQFPSYFIGTNADLPIVGGGILNHEHFHTGKYIFPIANAKCKYEAKQGNTTVKILDWPVSVIRLEGQDEEEMIKISTKILNKWRKYDDLESNIISNDTEPHNAITPILHLVDKVYVMDLALRNNRTSEKFPLGIFHPHEEYLHIKKENIGLFEIMGFAILPKRLKEEISLLKERILTQGTTSDASIQKHETWVMSFINNYNFTKENISKIFEDEIGKVVTNMLLDCAVFKPTEEGLVHFKKFINQIVSQTK